MYRGGGGGGGGVGGEGGGGCCMATVVVGGGGWGQWLADQEKILALLASWSFDQKPTAKRGNFSIEKVLSITKKRL